MGFWEELSEGKVDPQRGWWTIRTPKTYRTLAYALQHEAEKEARDLATGDGRATLTGHLYMGLNKQPFKKTFIAKERINETDTVGQTKTQPQSVTR